MDTKPKMEMNKREKTQDMKRDRKTASNRTVGYQK